MIKLKKDKQIKITRHKQKGRKSWNSIKKTISNYEMKKKVKQKNNINPC
jgi:hypothetical protein